MRIWPWSVIEELKASNVLWIDRYMDLYKSRDKVLKYMDTLEQGRHLCVSGRLHLFKPAGEWVEIDPEEVPYAPC